MIDIAIPRAHVIGMGEVGSRLAAALEEPGAGPHRVAVHQLGELRLTLPGVFHPGRQRVVALADPDTCSGPRDLDVDPQVVDRLVAQLEHIDFTSLNAEYVPQGGGADLAVGQHAEQLAEARQHPAADRLRGLGPPLWVDLKGRQLRVEAAGIPPYTDVRLSHRIRVRTPASEG